MNKICVTCGIRKSVLPILYSGRSENVFLLGTIVNGVAIIVGSLLGRILHRIPESMKTTVMYAIGLSVIVLGLQMGLESENFVIVIISLAMGAIAGEFLKLDSKFNTFGHWLETKMGKGEGSISEGFITASLIFVVGAVSIIGALDSGISGDHNVLYMKSIMDGFSALILSTTLGIGVLFSSVPVFLYQGMIALFASQIDSIVPENLMNQLITEITATGGVMIFAIGLNFMGLVKIKVANLLPGILIAIGIVLLLYNYQ